MLQVLHTLERRKIAMNPMDILGASASPLMDLIEWNPNDVPKAAGGYLLIAAKPGVEFTYPGGNSAVLYLGQSCNLRRRLKTHRKRILLAREKQRLYRPAYEYGAEFGTLYCWVQCQPGCCPKDLEVDLMARFATRFRSLPVANGAGAWKRIREIMAKANSMLGET